MALLTGDMKHQDYLEHTLSFEWKLNGSSGSWSANSPVLDLYDKRQCILEMQFEQDRNNSYIYNITMSLKLLENFDFKPSEKIRVCIHFKSSPYGKCTFILTKVDSKVSTNKQRLIFNNSLSYNDVINTIFEINCREYTSLVLVKDYTLLLNSEKYSDLTIDVRDKTFKVHKNIISSRNAVLAKMIEADMVEKRTNKITLNDWQPEIVEAFLIFIYTGTCQVENNFVELCQLAHFLQQSDLEKVVEKHMKHSIKMDNFVLLFEMADLYELKDLYDAVEKFFRVNKAECVKDAKFEPYLRKSIKVSNIKFVLEIAHEYSMNETLRDAMEFVKENYNKIAKNLANRNFIKNQNNLLFKIFEHSVGFLPDQQS